MDKCNVANGWCPCFWKPHFKDSPTSRCRIHVTTNYRFALKIKDCNHRKRMNRLEKVSKGDSWDFSDDKKSIITLLGDQWKVEKGK